MNFLSKLFSSKRKVPSNYLNRIDIRINASFDILTTKYPSLRFDMSKAQNNYFDWRMYSLCAVSCILVIYKNQINEKSIEKFLRIVSEEDERIPKTFHYLNVYIESFVDQADEIGFNTIIGSWFLFKILGDQSQNKRKEVFEMAPIIGSQIFNYCIESLE